jgi:hypothetical protein
MSRTGWRFHDRGRWHLDLIFASIIVNYTRDTPWSLPRITSWSFKIGRWTRNITRHTDTFDTPGRGYIRRRYR